MINYTASNFEGACTIDGDFKPYLDRMNTSAVKYGITVIVIDSLRKPVTYLPGEIVPPAKMSNHEIAEAIDANFKWGGKYWNSATLMPQYKMQGKFWNFIHECIEGGLRWGGLFNTPDTVHFDSGLNVHNPVLWQQKFNALNKANG